ncbi:serine threonine protein kinase : Putative uncharacterized protein OS=Gemmata sp. Wa1-1 PE=3 SV=1: Pkinase [Gemmata massiliana]|uniref:Protein kinase domain-containing protein n=1 Tax=Gemmata massiliana TaxID=1210884 RepID=A0A6P2DH12_9BACT|nr:serine/threonine-protein kinase [Gemmata massiliana]VTS00942.1 serine threonine protein kinase : Putative uncharacterized protein OS=Gemmata sp. Wa1-1 PE=3 SV=1: Pkinase [Gemmata massiliana]
MTRPAQASLVVAESAQFRTARAEGIKEAWLVTGCPDAVAALEDNPDLAADRAVAMDLAYEEFCTREEAGETVDASAFCARFPFGASLRRLLAVHRFIDDHPDVLGGSVPQHWPEIGSDVGDFYVLRELGRGSFARVYLAAETTAGGRPVALKVSVASSQEADKLGPLSHPHLTPVLSSRLVDEWNVVAMPFVGTATLEDVLSTAWHANRAGLPGRGEVLLKAAACGQQPNDPSFFSCPAFSLSVGATYENAVVTVAAGVFGGVAYLHDRGIAHRDLKPSNVLLGPNGFPYLLDFNLASHTADPWRLVGTLPYMAPEQLVLMSGGRADQLPDGRPGDVFACGVLLFELLTGRHPFRDPDDLPTKFGREQAAAALLDAQRTGRPNLAALNPRVRRTVRTAIERCLAFDPQKRPTAAELVELFTRVCAPPRRRFLVPVLVGTGVLALVLSYALLRPLIAPVDSSGAVIPPQPLTPFEQAMKWYREKKYDLAAAGFEKIARTENDGRAYGYWSHCLSALRLPGAIEAADKAILLGYCEVPVYANRSYNHLQTGNLKQAKDDCDAALKLDPNLLTVRLTRAEVYLQMHLDLVSTGKRAAIPPEAVTDIDQVIAGASDLLDLPDTWMVAAQIHLLAAGGNKDPKVRGAALEELRKAISLGKGPDTIRRNRILQALERHPAYEEVLATPRGSVASPSQNSRLVLPTS